MTVGIGGNQYVQMALATKDFRKDLYEKLERSLLDLQEKYNAFSEARQEYERLIPAIQKELAAKGTLQRQLKNDEPVMIPDGAEITVTVDETFSGKQE